MDKCTNCRKRLTYEDFEVKRVTDWEDVCLSCRQLPEVRGRWAVWAAQDRVRQDNMVKKLQHSE